MSSWIVTAGSACTVIVGSVVLCSRKIACSRRTAISDARRGASSAAPRPRHCPIVFPSRLSTGPTSARRLVEFAALTKRPATPSHWRCTGSQLPSSASFSVPPPIFFLLSNNLRELCWIQKRRHHKTTWICFSFLNFFRNFFSNFWNFFRNFFGIFKIFSEFFGIFFRNFTTKTK